VNGAEAPLRMPERAEQRARAFEAELVLAPLEPVEALQRVLQVEAQRVTESAVVSRSVAARAAWFGAAALIHLALNQRHRLPAFALVWIGGCVGGFVWLSHLLGPWFSYYVWDVPSHWSELSPLRIQHYLGLGLFGMLGPLTVASVLTLAQTFRPWRGPAALCRDSQILSPIDNQTLRAAHPPQIAQQDQHLQQRAHDLAALNLNCKRLWKLCGALSRALPTAPRTVVSGFRSGVSAQATKHPPRIKK